MKLRARLSNARPWQKAVAAAAVLGAGIALLLAAGTAVPAAADMECDNFYEICTNNCFGTYNLDYAACQSLSTEEQIQACEQEAQLKCDACIERCQIMHCTLPV